ncbi:zinc finger protein 277-like, partial [Ruditapes philippinarum]|uniref:zinc finger protein 277-like n=1 Tax=Ruditapes philippinarum TaxID=129788 RepID=UPI00295BCC51
MAASMRSDDTLFINTEKPVLEPLLLQGSWLGTAASGRESPRSSLQCVLCPEKLDISETLDAYLKHLLETHKFVIADVNLIANFKSYCLYWKERFKHDPLKEFCSEIQTTTTKK